MMEGSVAPNSNTVMNECVVLHKDGSLRVEEKRVDLADMEMGSVLLAVILGEVCGTDVHLRHGRLNSVEYPIIPGHVAVGAVHAIRGVVTDVEGLQVKEGDVVTFLDVIDTCYACIQCLVDKQSTRCPKRKVIGITCMSNHTTIKGLLGGWSRYLYLPPNTRIISLPKSLSPRNFMAGGCGLPTALHAIDRANIHLMDRVVIQGSGPVGLLSAILAQASGALEVIVIGAPTHRLEVFKKFGFNQTINIMDIPDQTRRKNLAIEMMRGRLADVVIEATGRPEAIAEGMSLCKDGGTYVVVGQYTDNGPVSINPHFLINRKHITVKGSWGSDFSHFYRGVQFMDKNSHLPWDLVVSKCFSLKDAELALTSVEKLEVFKALLEPLREQS
eukprot:TRINITY_DN7738_c0_g1_i1.p1 TRINITY_DN7738_c0_g1~~TRINITY_DN7738_c0_g1_i1.p1  ORF type:complete len:386 (+),score=54.57 TRINITY_DN7738_c0_g1_i1:17-1174(+)